MAATVVMAVMVVGRAEGAGAAAVVRGRGHHAPLMAPRKAPRLRTARVAVVDEAAGVAAGVGLDRDQSRSSPLSLRRPSPKSADGAAEPSRGLRS
jgi:hypothetical protein